MPICNYKRVLLLAMEDLLPLKGLMLLPIRVLKRMESFLLVWKVKGMDSMMTLGMNSLLMLTMESLPVDHGDGSLLESICARLQ